MLNLFKKKPKYNIKFEIQLILTDGNAIIHYVTYNRVKNTNYGKELVLKDIKEKNSVYLNNLDGFDQIIPIKNVKRLLFKTTILNEVK